MAADTPRAGASRHGVTMHDVARQAGVSQATVSLALSAEPGTRVSPRTVERVRAVADELGYRTNAFARSLRSGRSGMIGFISDEVATAPFAGRLLKGAQRRAWEAGFIILSVDTFGERSLEEAALEMIRSYRVDRIIFASMYHQRVTPPESLRGERCLVLNSQDATGQLPSIFPDEEQGGYDATRELIREGHRRIGMVNIQPEESDLPAGIGRLAGYRRALDEAGLAFDERLVLPGTGVVEDGERATAHLLDLAEPPTAIFCGNDRTAWGAYRSLAARGHQVGADISVVGFDDQESIAPDLSPGLTTMALPFESMGARAVDLLLARAPGAGDHPHSCNLVRRGSVRKAKVPA